MRISFESGVGGGRIRAGGPHRGAAPRFHSGTDARTPPGDQQASPSKRRNGLLGRGDGDPYGRFKGGVRGGSGTLRSVGVRPPGSGPAVRGRPPAVTWCCLDVGCLVRPVVNDPGYGIRTAHGAHLHGPVGECGVRAVGLIGPRALIVAEPADWLVGMIELGPVAWPPAPITTERLVLREPEARDRAAFIELLASPKVHTYLGGPRSRDELERETPGVPERWPGSFVVELDGAMIGQILLRRAKEHRRPAAAGKADLGYLFLPRAWGFGYAAEACAAALDWFRRRPSR